MIAYITCSYGHDARNRVENFGKLMTFALTIPVWQMIVYTLLISIFMLSHRVGFCLTTTYVFALYWIFHLFGPHFVTNAGGNPWAMTVYILFGFSLASLSIFSFFFFEE